MILSWASLVPVLPYTVYCIDGKVIINQLTDLQYTHAFPGKRLDCTWASFIRLYIKSIQRSSQQGEGTPNLDQITLKSINSLQVVMLAPALVFPRMENIRKKETTPLTSVFTLSFPPATVCPSCPASLQPGWSSPSTFLSFKLIDVCVVSEMLYWLPYHMLNT